MAKDMHERFSVRMQPIRDSFEQEFVVAHVFEHFDGDDAIELLLDIKLSHISRDDLNVVQTSFSRLCLDELTLAGRVGYCGDLDIRIMLSKPQS